MLEDTEVLHFFLAVHVMDKAPTHVVALVVAEARTRSSAGWGVGVAAMRGTRTWASVPASASASVRHAVLMLDAVVDEIKNVLGVLNDEPSERANAEVPLVHVVATRSFFCGNNGTNQLLNETVPIRQLAHPLDDEPDGVLGSACICVEALASGE